ncbi:MAG: ROK family protein [Ilumatobacteraceae bacterium]
MAVSSPARRGWAASSATYTSRPDGILEPDQPTPRCACGFWSDAESYASLAASGQPAPLLARHGSRTTRCTRWPRMAAKQVRALAEARPRPLALKVFEQQAMALGHLFTVAANFTDPDAFFVGGGVVETDPWFRTWFLDTVRALCGAGEQAERTEFALVHDASTWPAPAAAIAALHARLSWVGIRPRFDSRREIGSVSIVSPMRVHLDSEKCQGHNRCCTCWRPSCSTSTTTARPCCSSTGITRRTGRRPVCTAANCPSSAIKVLED